MVKDGRRRYSGLFTVSIPNRLEHVEHGRIVMSHALFPLACPLIKDNVLFLGREMTVYIIECLGTVEIFLPHAVRDLENDAYLMQHADAFRMLLAAIAGPHPEITPYLIIVGMTHRPAVFDQEILGKLVVLVPDVPLVGYLVADGKQHLHLVGMLFRIFMEPDVGPLSDSAVLLGCREMPVLLVEGSGSLEVLFPYGYVHCFFHLIGLYLKAFLVLWLLPFYMTVTKLGGMATSFWSLMKKNEKRGTRERKTVILPYRLPRL